MNIHTKKGYIALEAAIVLPLFIIAVLTVGFTMKNIYYTETCTFVVRSETAVHMKDAYVMPVSVTFPNEITDKIMEKLPELENVKVEDYRYRYSSGSENELISFNVVIVSNTSLPGDMFEDYEIRSAFLCRAFCGKDNSASTSFSVFASDLESEKVYVFPERGMKYHAKDCSYVNSYPLKTVYSKNIKKKYKACSICDPENLRDGSSVYVFEYGNAYHTAACNSVDKYIVSMDRRDAQRKGYTACLKCGGLNE